MKIRTIAAAILILAPGVCLGASSFDGSWTVSQSCPPTAQDVRGYSWTYAAVVRNGMLVGEHRPTSAQDGSGRLTGRIRPDGEAMLTADGRTGNPEFAVGHVAQGFHYHYRVAARFTDSSGSGQRTEQRSCDFSFTKN